MTDEKLKLCPFCGGRAVFLIYPENINKNILSIMRCKRCGIERREYNKEKKDMFRIWNTRQSPTLNEGKLTMVLVEVWENGFNKASPKINCVALAMEKIKEIIR